MKLYVKKNKHIVIKIGPEGKTLHHEYRIGQLLYEAKLPGFIKFICKFSCLDDNDSNKKNGIPITRVCQSTTDNPKNQKDVLIMPYIQEGSIKRAIWTEEKIPILKTLLVQCVVSICMAYMEIGFIHNDLHLDNVLYKRTKQVEFYPGIPSNGYKIVIMDFEGCMTGVDRLSGLNFYWKSLQNLLFRVDTDLRSDPNDGRIHFKNMVKIQQYIENLPPPDAINPIIDLIINSKVELFKKPQLASYDPNVF